MHLHTWNISIQNFNLKKKENKYLFNSPIQCESRLCLHLFRYFFCIFYTMKLLSNIFSFPWHETPFVAWQQKYPSNSNRTGAQSYPSHPPLSSSSVDCEWLTYAFSTVIRFGLDRSTQTGDPPFHSLFHKEWLMCKYLTENVIKKFKTRQSNLEAYINYKCIW